jgi:hypothetical protein
MPALPTAVAHLPIDWVILGLFAVLVSIDALRSGPRRAVTFSLAGPIALLAASELSYTAFIGDMALKLSATYAQSAFFGIFFVVLVVLIYLMLPSSSGSALPLPAILAGIAATAVLAVILIQLPLVSNLVVVSTLMHTIFSAAYRLYWLIGAYLLLAIAGRMT